MPTPLEARVEALETAFVELAQLLLNGDAALRYDFARRLQSAKEVQVDLGKPAAAQIIDQLADEIIRGT